MRVNLIHVYNTLRVSRHLGHMRMVVRVAHWSTCIKNILASMNVNNKAAIRTNEVASATLRSNLVLSKIGSLSFT